MIPVFSTFHPSFLETGRSPSAIHSVEDHLQVLIDYLRGDSIVFGSEPPALTHILVAPRPPSSMPSLISLDIETYGAIEGPEQRYFCPEKSMQLDGIPRDQLIKTVSIAWHPVSAPQTVQTAIFVWGKRAHRHRLRAWLQSWARQSNPKLLGMNIVFDVLYLRACDPVIRRLLDPFPEPGQPAVQLVDLAVISYLHSELRPERSLKALAPLFAFCIYDKERMGTYRGARDPDLWVYNAQDAWATLLLVDYLSDRIRRDYGPDTAKLTPYCINWYSRLLWNIVSMSEAGMPFNRCKLNALYAKTSARMAELESKVADDPQEPGPLQGKGSGKYVRALVDRMAPKLSPDAQDLLELTAVKQEISTDIHNLYLFQQNLPPDDPDASILDCLMKFRRHQKLLTSYLNPLLVGRGKKADDKSACLLKGSRVYPSWYAVPMARQEKEDTSGGTNQGRIVCNQPALQTNPKSIRACLTTRFRDGVLICADKSQVELRFAALLSNDPVMTQAYVDGRDLHTDRAVEAFGPDIVNHPDFKAVYRWAAKQSNFACLYRGSPDTIQATILKDTGRLIPIEIILACVKAFWLRHRVLRRWQDSLVEQIKVDGYLELPLIGQSRWYAGCEDAVEADVYTICNQPVQCTAANDMLSTQDAITAEFRRQRLYAVIGLQVYDSIYVDCPGHEEPRVHAILDEHMTNSVYFRDLCDHLGRTIPLAYDYEIKVDHRRTRRAA